MRKYITINDGWSFTGPDRTTKEISIPHTWNNIDGQDGGNDYKRCEGTYMTCIATEK